MQAILDTFHALYAGLVENLAESPLAQNMPADWQTALATASHTALLLFGFFAAALVLQGIVYACQKRTAAALGAVCLSAVCAVGVFFAATR